MAAAPASAPPTSSSATSEPTHFVVMVTGQIEAGRYEGLDSLYCRYAFTFGDDWKVVSGVEEGITQLSTASGGGGEQGLLAVWNFPVDVTFRATSAHGWPQIVISVYGNDSFGRSDVIIGYGAIHLPIGPGRHELYIRTFRPLASSLWLRFQSWVNGMRPEFIDSLFPSKGEGRDVTRVQSFGVVKLALDVTVQGMDALGYKMPPVARTPMQLEHDPFMAAS